MGSKKPHMGSLLPALEIEEPGEDSSNMEPEGHDGHEENGMHSAVDALFPGGDTHTNCEHLSNFIKAHSKKGDPSDEEIAEGADETDAEPE